MPNKAERLRVLEEAVGEELLAEAAKRLKERDEADCAAGNHVWVQIAYDLQGGKWGTNRCTKCGVEQGWSV